MATQTARKTKKTSAQLLKEATDLLKQANARSDELALRNQELEAEVKRIPGLQKGITDAHKMVELARQAIVSKVVSLKQLDEMRLKLSGVERTLEGLSANKETNPADRVLEGGKGKERGVETVLQTPPPA